MSQLPDLYEVCSNPSCDENKNGVEFSVGTSLCPTCGTDLDAKDRSSSLTKALNFLGLGKKSPVAPSSTASAVTGTRLTVKIRGVIPAVFDAGDVQEFAFLFGDQGGAQAETPGRPMVGDITDGEITIGALQPAMTWRPTLDLSAYCAFSPNVSQGGERIPVAVSRHMASIRCESGQVMLKAANASNRPRLVEFASDGSSSVGRSMVGNDEVIVGNEDMFIMGDFILQFKIEQL